MLILQQYANEIYARSNKRENYIKLKKEKKRARDKERKTERDKQRETEIDKQKETERDKQRERVITGKNNYTFGYYAVPFPQKFIQLLSPPEKNVRSIFMILIRTCATCYDIYVLF